MSGENLAISERSQFRILHRAFSVSGGYSTVTLAVLEDENADTLLSELVSGMSWDIITNDKAKFKLNMHFELHEDGPAYYAVVPENYLGEEGFTGTGYLSVCSFEYVRPTVLLAISPDGSFTSEEEKDVIKILSSFRVK